MNLVISMIISATLGYFAANQNITTEIHVDPAQVEIIHPKVIAFKKQIYSYNTDKVLDYLVQTDSCGKSSNKVKEIYLLINKNALLLDEKHETVADVNHFYALQDIAKAKKKNDKYSQTPLCYKNKDMLKEINSTWNQEFRSKYEINPVIKQYDYKKEITIAVIDTGVNFKDSIIYDSIPQKYKNNINALNFSGTTNYDKSGHGSHVTGIILGVMPKAKILPLKYNNPNKSGDFNLNASINALQFAISQNVDIINYSGGGPEFSQREFDMFKKAHEKGILVIAAAGNELSDIDDKKNHYYPASYDLDNILVIGNSEYTDIGEQQLHTTSNYGRESVDFIMRGSRVRSLAAGESSCGLAYSTGTSMSTPAFTGVIASLMSQHPNASVKQILNHLSKIAQPTDTNSKFGYLDLSAALNAPFEYNERELASNTDLNVK